MSQIEQIAEAVLVALFPVSATNPNPNTPLRDLIRDAVASVVKESA